MLLCKARMHCLHESCDLLGPKIPRVLTSRFVRLVILRATFHDLLSKSSSHSSLTGAGELGPEDGGDMIVGGLAGPTGCGFITPIIS